MSNTDYLVPVPDSIAEKLDEVPVVLRSRKLERAIHAALDREGFPNLNAKGELPETYVNIWYRNGSLKGHVGPISDGKKAASVALSWRKSGHHARMSSLKLGPCLMYAPPMGELLS